MAKTEEQGDLNIPMALGALGVAGVVLWMVWGAVSEFLESIGGWLGAAMIALVVGAIAYAGGAFDGIGDKVKGFFDKTPDEAERDVTALTAKWKGRIEKLPSEMQGAFGDLLKMTPKDLEEKVEAAFKQAEKTVAGLVEDGGELTEQAKQAAKKLGQCVKDIKSDDIASEATQCITAFGTDLKKPAAKSK